MKKKSTSQSAFFNLRILTASVFCVLGIAVALFAQGKGPEQTQQTNRLPAGCSWSAGPAMPTVLVRAVGVYFPTNGNFYTMGGRTGDTAGDDFQHALQYTPGTNSWVQKASTFPDNQMNNMACGVLTVSGTPSIYCVGGSAAGAATATGRVFSYNPVTDTPATLTGDDWPGAMGTILPGGFTVANNKLYVLGGFNINVASTNQIWQFDPTAAVGSKWTQKVNTPEGVMYAATCTIGIIYLAGASDYQGGTVVDTTNSFSFDPVTNTIGSIPPIPRATGETRALNFNGQMYVMGGGRVAPNPSNEVDVCCWSIGIPFVTGRRNFPTDTNGTDQIWLAGGYDVAGVPIASMEIFTCQGTPSPTPTATATPTATPSPTPTPMGCYVTSPACGTIVHTQPTDFIIDLSDPVDPVSVQPSDFTVNGTPANADAIINGNTTISFHFNTSPVVQGQNTMHIPACAFNCGNGCVQEFTCTFTYQPSTPTPTPTDARHTPVPRVRPTPAPRP